MKSCFEDQFAFFALALIKAAAASAAQTTGRRIPTEVSEVEGFFVATQKA